MDGPRWAKKDFNPWLNSKNNQIMVARTEIFLNPFLLYFADFTGKINILSMKPGAATSRNIVGKGFLELSVSFGI